MLSTSSALSSIVGDLERDSPVSREINHMREHQHEMRPRLVAFMERAYSLIERSNASHGPDAPAAVILQAVEDENDAFTSMSHLPQFARLAKTHYVVLKVIGGHESLGPVLNEIGQQLGTRPIMTLIIRAHGFPTTLCLSDDNRYTIEDVCAEDFACLHPSASIILEACWAGEELGGKIASVQPRPVFANMRAATDIFLTSCCSTHGYGMVSFYNNEMITRIFQQEGEVVPCIASKIKKIERTIFQHNMQTAQQGEAFAQFNVAKHYWYGRGVTQSYQEAIQWYRRAAAQGYSNAQFNLALYYQEGIGVTQSYADAAKWYREAAKQGDKEAQFRIAEYYENGVGVTRSYQKAVKWYQRAAEQGHAEACYKLGSIYENGAPGVHQSYSEASSWYRKAIMQGHTQAWDYFNAPFSTQLYRIGVGVLNTLRRVANP